MEIESTPEKSSVADAVAFDLKTHKASKSIGVSMRAQVAIAKITQTDARLVELSTEEISLVTEQAIPPNQIGYVLFRFLLQHGAQTITSKVESVLSVYSGKLGAYKTQAKFVQLSDAHFHTIHMFIQDKTRRTY